MDQNIVATAEAVIKTTREKAWQALTDPAIIKLYFFGVEVETTWQEGSPITYHGEWEGKKFEDKGVVIKNVPNDILESTYWTASFGPEIPDNYVLVRYQLSDAQDGGVPNTWTRVTITQEGNKDQAGAEHSSKNWQMVLDGLKKLLES